MSNRLKTQNSPYLLQHADNPVDWFPWCAEAFEKAKREDKPVFVSIGYSTCHWCHVMAHESFEDAKTAELLNKYFVSVKVDREERPDLDSVYLSVCQAFTGSGGWPMSIFMTAQQKPFFAGTYFPPESRYGMPGFSELLRIVAQKWQTGREQLLESADGILAALTAEREYKSVLPPDRAADLILDAVDLFSQRFDRVNGGFGPAPKFPIPHNMIFLMLYAKRNVQAEPLQQALFTLRQMRRGGIFDQIGYGFSRYSTDARFLVPHFEKMLYDNALLILAYTVAFRVSGEREFLTTAAQTADYVLGEMTGEGGAFYSAQDADSDGEEGRYYVFSQEEICRVIGAEKGMAYCRHFGITKEGNFEGKSIPNLLHADRADPAIESAFEEERKRLYDYRKTRTKLHLDDKILTSWNGLMVCALSYLYRASGQARYLDAAKKAQAWAGRHLTDGRTLYAGWRNGVPFSYGFLDDYAYETLALLALYGADGDPAHLERAKEICLEAMEQFEDAKGGYFLSGAKNESLWMRPKETYDGALPSGNSVLAYCLVRLSQLTQHPRFQDAAQKQLAFLSRQAAHDPSGYTVFLTALLYEEDPPEKITVVLADGDTAEEILPKLPLDADLTVLSHETDSYKLFHGKTTYYVCQNFTCHPPVNQLEPYYQQA